MNVTSVKVEKPKLFLNSSLGYYLILLMWLPKNEKQPCEKHSESPAKLFKKDIILQNLLIKLG